ncbi:MAG: selenocysteine-specific translation elongation factor [Oscillospiraceae bacterium]|nr:selenocysteine-specific translation elongation factor [Oscillospiraceae bacterium]
MRHVIIGTAGHVDHGKTALVKALTGIDTDRLEEEKRRGVTIEPGFAYIDFDDGSRAGIIDVPGHERFIRNMLAGAGGVDLAMLVIAADEGVMPQTREHLGILIQLGISDGLVAVTKSDKAEPDWLELVLDDIAGLINGTFLENKPLIPVSAHSGDGLSDLKKALETMLKNVGEKDTDIPFRLPVDRVFPVDGFGTVVTGTLIEGSVKVGDTAEILPSGEKAPVRNIQVHGENYDAAYAGQRTAISLGGVKRGNVVRGDVITAEGMLSVTNAIDVKLTVMQNSERTIKNSSEIHLYHGARTMLAKVFLFDKTELHHGESCFARLKLKEPLPCKRGDRFVVRFYSPLETIGGGVILDSKPKSRISRSESMIDALTLREKGSVQDIAELAAYELDGVFTEIDLCKRADISKKACLSVLEELLLSSKIVKLQTGKYISGRVLTKLDKKCNTLLDDYHKTYPLRAGMNIAELRQKLMPDAETSEATAVLKSLSDSGKDSGKIIISEKSAVLSGFSITYTPAQSKIKDKLLVQLDAAKYDVPTPEELSTKFTKNEKREFEQIFESLISSGELIMLSQQVYWQKAAYDEAVSLLKTHFEKNEEITLAECRDMLKTSRKYALAFLEHLDGKQITILQGDKRKLAKGWIKNGGG